MYYAYSKDLKNSGNRFAYGTATDIPLGDQGIIQFRGAIAAPPAAGAVTVGNIKFTWYVRFHGRTRPAGPALLPKYVAPKKVQRESDKENEDPQEASEMSYADLQQQVMSLMGNRKQ